MGFGALLYMGGVPLSSVFLIILTSILIDIDHVVNYIIKFKNCNISEMFRYFNRRNSLNNNNIILPVFLFHNFETIILLILISCVSYTATCILLGVLLHMILDWIVIPVKRYPAIIKISLIWTLIENNRRKKGHPKW